MVVNQNLISLQAVIALKKGAQLLKYGRKGKPKFYPFRLSSVSLLLEYPALKNYIYIYNRPSTFWGGSFPPFS